MKVRFIFNSEENYYGKWAFYLVLNYGVTSLYAVLGGINSMPYWGEPSSLY
jgi:hypothetical protein